MPGTAGNPLPPGHTVPPHSLAPLSTSGSGTNTTSSESTQHPGSSMEFDTATPTGNNCRGGHFFPPRHNLPPENVEYAENPCNCNAIHKEASTRFARDEDKLQVDGANFHSWLNEITKFAILSLDNPEFYNRPQPDSPKEVVA
ncbi:hypothetical protein PCASD_12716 [Puccinia coronata f. sp. avenae]|uniref:Uncharacterized protein n=1 Tax=Puccinia coronata f. sp. avenae TaxID=200324 RepID=A0A2N5UCQ4_9BASI|nr:hypothetical protein PCASD_12716 [Puccinia coronata f. sp. avenae]